MIFLEENIIGMIPLPEHKSKTVLFSLDFANLASNTLSLPKQKYSLF